MKVNTYLNYGGNCAEAFRFYEQHLGAKVVMMMTHGQMPGGPPVAHELKDTIMYARLDIGDTYVMGSDVSPQQYQPMRSAYLCLSVDSSAEAERVYGALSAGGEIFMKLDETFFAFKFAMLRDKFGTSWMIIHEKPMQGPA